MLYIILKIIFLVGSGKLKLDIDNIISTDVTIEIKELIYDFIILAKFCWLMLKANVQMAWAKEFLLMHFQTTRQSFEDPMHQPKPCADQIEDDVLLWYTCSFKIGRHLLWPHSPVR